MNGRSRITSSRINDARGDPYTIGATKLSALYKFTYLGKVFYAHNLVDVRGRLCVGTWQFSHEGVPITYISTPSITEAHTEFVWMAKQMGDAEFLKKLKEASTANQLKMRAAADDKQ